MTLASKLLEGYYPEEGGYVLEGMTPEVMMNQVNAICTECITGLYEAAQQYFTDDIIGQAEVITEGAGIIDKIKEAIGKFIQKIKDIWAWFVKKVKAFPAWIKSLFTKSAEATAEVVQKAEKSVGINHKMVECVSFSVISKYEKLLDECLKMLDDEAGSIDDLVSEINAADTLAEMDKLIKESMQKVGGNFSENNIKKLGELKKLAQAEMDDADKNVAEMDDVMKRADLALARLDEIKKSFQNSSKFERIAATKVLAEAKRIYKKSMGVTNSVVKPLQQAIAKTEKMLSEINNPSFQKKMEQVFIQGYADNGGKGDVTATAAVVSRTFISATSKELSSTSAMMNKMMTMASNIASGYSAISSKLRSAVSKGKSGGEGDSGEKPADNKE